MKLFDFFSLLGGLALFLYGMKMMSESLRAAAGKQLKLLLEKLTANPLMGVLAGAAVTAIIQSSSATTVLTVGFVDSGLMSLSQAVGVIMGANIGTTVTGQLIALDIGGLAPLLACAGVVIAQKKKHLGEGLMGMALLFIGMDFMGEAMSPLQNSPLFVRWMTSVSNPLLGILLGAVFTALMQSSSASVGILQALAGRGLLPLNSAVYILFGQNIGTCITAVLASIGTNRNAKRVTVIHLLFNLLGTIFFLLFTAFFPLTDWAASLAPNRPEAQIAHIHTIFNLTTAILLFPFRSRLTKIAQTLLPDENPETLPSF